MVGVAATTLISITAFVETGLKSDMQEFNFQLFYYER